MNPSTERRYDLDWLRVIGVFLLVPFHAALIFVLDPKSVMYIKDTVNSRILDHFAGFIHLWHMPMLFFVSGAATYFALGRRSAGQYISERFSRLLVPFVAGILAYLPFTTYIRQIGRRTFTEHYVGFFRVNLNRLDGYNGTFTPAHLWFILFLFIFSMVALPLFLIWRKRKLQKGLSTKKTIWHSPAAVILMGIPLALAASLNILGDQNPLYYFLVFVYGYFLISDGRNQRSIDNLTWFALGYGIFEAVFRIVVPQWRYSEWSLPWVTLGIMYELGRWMLTVAILGLAHKFLNHNSRFLKYANEAAMPFYLLHMTFSVLAGYFVIRFNLPIGIKYILIVLLATGSTLVAYEVLRRWNLTRVLLGMRPIKKPVSHPEAALKPERS